MPTVNEKLADAATSHAVDLAGYSNGVVRRIIGLLNRVDARLFAELGQALETMSPESFTVDRLESLLLSVRQLNLQAYQQIERELTQELRELVQYEAGYQLQLFQSVIPAQVIATVGVSAVNAEQVYAAALSRPFQGALLREFSQRQEATKMARIRDTIRMGYVENRTTQEIVRQLRGTRAKGYSDGIIELDRRQTEAVVRTAISHTAGFTRDRFYEANDDIIKAVVWVSTLDARTSSECRVRDGLKYGPIDHKPIGHSVPWLGGPGRLHWSCRSSSAPVTRSWRELGIALDEMDAGTRASMDGQVPAEMNYQQWLAKQSASRQDEVLGPTRGKLFRQGGLPMDRFYNDKGVFLDLPQLRERDARAFAKAGL